MAILFGTRKFGFRFGDYDNLTLTLVSEGIKLVWTDETGGASYSIYRKSSGDRASSLIAVVTKLAYIDKTPMFGLDYEYEVIANTGFSLGLAEITFTCGIELYNLVPKIWRYLDGN